MLADKLRQWAWLHTQRDIDIVDTGHTHVRLPDGNHIIILENNVSVNCAWPSDGSGIGSGNMYRIVYLHVGCFFYFCSTET